MFILVKHTIRLYKIATKIIKTEAVFTNTVINNELKIVPVVSNIHIAEFSLDRSINENLRLT